VLAWGTDSAADSRVQLATQLGPLDPFDDPFGDHQPPESRQRSVLVAPIAVQPPFAEDLLPGPPATEPPATEQPPSPELTPAQPSLEPSPSEAAPTPPSDSLPAPRDPGYEPLTPLQPLEPAKPCERIYNQRNCCAEGEECQLARTAVRDMTIDKISLNISPSIKPDAMTKAEEEELRALRLAKAGVRTWRNRQGEVVARGELTDLEYGRIFIKENGEVKKFPVRDLSDDDWCFLAAWWGVPTECSLPDETYQPRAWLASTMTWKASALCHKPLYFEEVQLERYGHTVGPWLEPVVSGAHFCLNIAALPYHMGLNPPNECRYALGYYRPGSCAPWLVPPLPLSLRAGLWEAGAIVGGVYLIP